MPSSFLLPLCDNKCTRKGLQRNLQKMCCAQSRKASREHSCSYLVSVRGSSEHLDDTLHSDLFFSFSTQYLTHFIVPLGKAVKHFKMSSLTGKIL